MGGGVSGPIIVHTEGSVCQLLAERHSKDVWVPGCALGSRTHGCRELDGWALLRTWSPVTTIGYEVKVARSDWLRDQKVGEYQKRVHLMYVVAPKGIVQVSELPAGCGLLEVTQNGKRLLTRAKAVRNEHPDDRLLLLYVLMCRSRVVSDYHAANNGSMGLDFWRSVAEGKVESHLVGRLASKRVATLLRTATHEAHQAKGDRDRWLPAITALAEILGLPLEQVQNTYSHELVGLLRQRAGLEVEPAVKNDMRRARQVLESLERAAADLRSAFDRALSAEGRARGEEA